MFATVIDLPAHKKVLKIAVPLILFTVTVPLLGLVDTAVIGDVGDAKYLAAITAGAWIFTF